MYLFDKMFFFFDLTEGLIGLLESRRGQDGAYIGCMKSGDVVTQEFVYTQLYSVNIVIDHYTFSLFIFHGGVQGKSMVRAGVVEVWRRQIVSL